MKSSDFLAYEDLKIASLVKNHRLAKSISDASWGLFLSWVRYYGRLHGIPVVAVSPATRRRIAAGCGFRVKKTLSHADPYVPFLWAGAGSGLECRAEHSAGCPGVGSRTPYRRAGGNGFRFGGTQRFWTEDLYGRKRLRSVKPAG